jgi:hypothetical protein
LIEGSDRIQDRLSDAFLSFKALNLNDFPKDLSKELKEDFEAIQNELMKGKALRDESRINASIKAMSDEQANDLAERILNLFISITERYGRMFP